MVLEWMIGSLTSSAPNEITAPSSGQLTAPGPRMPSRKTLLVTVALLFLRCSALIAALGPGGGPPITRQVGALTRLASSTGELLVRSTATPTELAGDPGVMA